MTLVVKPNTEHLSPDNEKEIYRANDMCMQVKYREPRIHVVSVNQHGNQVEDSNTITKSKDSVNFPNIMCA